MAVNLEYAPKEMQTSDSSEEQRFGLKPPL